MRYLLMAVGLFCAACTGTGQPEASYEAYAVMAPSDHLEVGDWEISLYEAKVAFGPTYFCAAASGSATLCEAATAELATIVTLDGLDPDPQPLGRVRGFVGDLRSASYDYGIHWYPSESTPTADPHAPEGHSAVLRGQATRGAESVGFVALVDAVAQIQGQRVVPSAPVAAHVAGDEARLDVRLDAGSWLGGVDFDALAAAGPGPVTIQAGDRDHDAIVIAMTSTSQPVFTWSGADASPIP